jgi:AcrR family transcriptional regulator
MPAAPRPPAARGVTGAAGAATGRPMRRDARERRDALMTAVASLLAERGPGFSLTEVARRAGISPATAYRHFRDTAEVIECYYGGLTRGLLDAFDELPGTGDPIARIRGICGEWARQAAGWGPAAVYLRSPRGFLSRLDDGDPFITGLHQRLRDAVQAAADAGALPGQDLRYAVLIWVSIFDERVVVDLTGSLGLSPAEAARRLSDTLLAALRAGTPGEAPPPPPGPGRRS